MNVIWRIAAYFRPYLPQVILAMILSIMVGFLEGGLALFVKPVFDEIFFGKNASFLKWIPIVMLTLVAMKGIFSYFHTFILEKVGALVIQEIRLDLFENYLHLGQSQFDHLPTGHLMSRITNDVNGIQATVPAFIQIIRQAFTLMILMSVALYRDWKLTMLGLAVVPFTGIPVWIIGEKLKKYRRKTLRSMGSLNSVAYEAFGGIQVIKAFCAEDVELGKFKEEHRKYLRTRIKAMFIGMWAVPITEVVSIAGVSAIFVLGGLNAIRGDLTPGEFFSFVAAVMLMYRPIRRLSDIYKGMVKLLGAGERVFEALDERPMVREKENAVDIKPIERDIKFRDVWFQYPLPSQDIVHRADELQEGEELRVESLRDAVVKGVSFTVNKGERVALVGSSGAGKSTIVLLLPRFYDIDKGAITIDDVDIRDVTFSSLRSQMAIVTQDTFLFNETVHDNIAYGVNRVVTREEVVEAARAANAHDFILNLSEGYDTVVGERGVKLSGGQRQRLSIARAILRNAPILILDEATSNLDSEAELEVQKALEVLVRDRTTIVIAHRLSTIRDADRIVVLEDGQKVEEGNHAELIARGGVYKRLYELQYFGQQDEAATG